MQSGKILKLDTPAGITNDYNYPLFAVKSDNIYQLINDLRSYPHAQSVYAFGDSVHYADRRSSVKSEQISEYLISKNHPNFEIFSINPNIEDCFMDLISKSYEQHHA